MPQMSKTHGSMHVIRSAMPPAWQTSVGQPAPPLPEELQSSGQICDSLASQTPLPQSPVHSLQSSGQVEQVSRPLQEPSPQIGPQSVVQSLGQKAHVSPASQTPLPQDAPPVDEDDEVPEDDELLADDEDFDDELDLPLLSSPPSPLPPSPLRPPSLVLPPEPPPAPVGWEEPSAQPARSAAPWRSAARSAAAPTKRNELGRMFMTASSQG